MFLSEIEPCIMEQDLKHFETIFLTDHSMVGYNENVQNSSIRRIKKIKAEEKILWAYVLCKKEKQITKKDLSTLTQNVFKQFAIKNNDDNV